MKQRANLSETSLGWTFHILLFALLAGVISEGRGEDRAALGAFFNAFVLDASYVPSKILESALMLKLGSKGLPVARSLLSDALRIDPTNCKAWYYLGMVHNYDGRMSDAADCFQAASMLEESDPVESFSTVL